MNQRLPLRVAHSLRLPLALTVLALLGACSSSSTSPPADLSACGGNTMVTLSAVAVPPAPTCDPTKPTTLKIHYHRDDGDYAGWGLHVWTLVPPAPGTQVVTATTWASPLAQAGTDAFGVTFQPTVLASSGTVGYIFHKGDTKDLPDDQSHALKCGDNEIWRLSGDTTTYLAAPPTGGVKDIATVRVHYRRFDGAFDQWGLHLFAAGGIDPARLPGLALNDWNSPVPFSAMPGYAASADGSEVTFDIPVLNPVGDATRTALTFVIHGMPSNPNGGVDNKDGRSGDIVVNYSRLTVAAQVGEVWLAQEDANVYPVAPDLRSASTTDARAVWLTHQLIQWPKVNGTGVFKLYRSATAKLLAARDAKVTGADGAITLDVFTGTIPPDVATRFKYLSGGVVLSVKAADLAGMATMLRDQLVLVQEDAAGLVQNATTLQVAGALDALYAAANAATADLGVSLAAGQTAFKVWAPTARKVSLCTYDSGSGAATGLDAMSFDAATGSWSTAKPGDLSGKYYRYAVEVFARGVGVVRNLVTDPYSVSLSADSARSYVADLGAAGLRPAGWDTTLAPATVAAQTDMVIYELHVRDFSVSDPTVSAANRGKYLAFTEGGSNGMKHLKALAQAGLTDVHLLPVFDLATIPELAAERADLDSPFETVCPLNPLVPAWYCTNYRGQTVRSVMETYPADSDQQQALAGFINDVDSFNWGYDPLHYTAPEGSYASDAADGAKRVVEFRQMVTALHQAGLRVGMDVVYNHTSADGQAEKSVLDRVVPGYYHRLGPSGEVLKSTCCSNTATENAMMGKLMSDSVVTWATQYKIDSFRFDLMGYQPRAVMEAIKARLKTVTGRDIQLIGEGWNDAEVKNGARFVQASQLSLNDPALGDSGIATFSDRARDRIRGGGPFDSGASLVANQGYVNGLAYDPNPTGPSGAAGANALLAAGDMVKLGLAGSLRDYQLTTFDGTVKSLWDLDYGGAPAGYVLQPANVVNYVENHDNQTLYDINTYKLPVGTAMGDRVRVQMLGAALNAFSQGVAYFHAGVDTLRSKSMDRNSYNSGDWFNQLDWSYQSNNFGVGLPMKGDNQPSYAQMTPLLGNATLKPGPADIALARDMFRDLLAIRKSSTLFRMRAADDVTARLAFLNTGPSQEPTVIAGHLDGDGYAGAAFKELLYLVNVDKVAHQLVLASEQGKAYVLHPVQASASAADPRPRTDAAFDGTTGTFTVPPRTAVVYVVN